MVPTSTFASLHQEQAHTLSSLYNSLCNGLNVTKVVPAAPASIRWMLVELGERGVDSLPHWQEEPCEGFVDHRPSRPSTKAPTASQIGLRRQKTVCDLVGSSWSFTGCSSGSGLQVGYPPSFAGCDVVRAWLGDLVGKKAFKRARVLMRVRVGVVPGGVNARARFLPGARLQREESLVGSVLCMWYYCT